VVGNRVLALSIAIVRGCVVTSNKNALGVPFRATLLRSRAVLSLLATHRANHVGLRHAVPSLTQNTRSTAKQRSYNSYNKLLVQYPASRMVLYFVWILEELIARAERGARVHSHWIPSTAYLPWILSTACA